MAERSTPPRYPILDNIEVPDMELENWQATIDLLAEIAEIPAALIMRVHAQEIEVLLSSHTPGNVYHPGEKAPLDTGLYCETVMDTQNKLIVPNALKDPAWDHNPDIELGMISYCGLPLIWPGGEIFGAICILDNKENGFNHRVITLMERFRDSIQFSLENIYNSSVARQQAVKTVRNVEKLFFMFMQHSPIYVYIKEVTPAESRVLYASDNFREMIGISGPDMAGKTMAELFPPEFAAKISADDWSVASGGEVLTLEEQLSDRVYTTIKFPLALGEKTLLAGYTIDITERKRNEAINAARLHLIQFSETHSLGEILEETVNEAEKLTSSLIGFYHFVDSDQKTLSLQNWSTRTKAEFCKAKGRGAHYDIAAAGVWVDCIHQRKPVIHNDYATLPHRKGMPEGHAPVIRELVAPVIRAEKITAILGVGNKPAAYNQQDLEAISLFVDLAWEIAERKKLEEQLRHSQKMEAVGTLAGGIAHDFNNILSAIVGYGHLTLMKLPHGDPVKPNVEHILESADRAAALTQSLLAFSRKQIAERKPVELNTIIRKVEKFLARVIGEDVAIHLTLAEQNLAILADAGQLEQVFMNLATNARDAMPEGGLLNVEAGSRRLDDVFIKEHGHGTPGEYALIAVSDSGIGMDEPTRRRIFEPFFTTKETGKGTGLGLSMVYGIVKQHDGFITVYSEPDKGTTFRIYLPLIAAGVSTEEKTPVTLQPERGGETILYAEDDQHVREFAASLLQEFGYTVIVAKDGEDAVKAFKENRERIHLLLFDLIMPKKSGKEAYDEIIAMNPEVRAIFSSGYAPDIIQRKGLIEEGIAIISKPVSPADLLRKVRSVLDGRRA